MKRYYFIICLLCMLFANAINAQNIALWTVHFTVAATLPPDAKNQVATGFAGAVAGVHQNHLLLAGGANFPESMPWQGGKKHYHDAVYVYASKDQQIEIVNQSFRLPEKIAYAAVCNISDGVLYIGGENENGISNKVWLLQWDQYKKQVITKAYPPIPIALTNAAVTVVNKKVYIAGGETANEPTSHFFMLDLSNITTGWKTLPAIPQAVSHTVLVGLGNATNPALYLMGGRKKNPNGISTLYSNMYEFDLFTNRWNEKASLPYALSAGTGIWCKADQIVLFGGDKGTVFTQVETLLAAIANETNPDKKQALINQKNQLQSTHPGFSNEVLLYQANKNEWQTIGKISFDTPVTTTAVKWNDAVYLPTGETKAGVRSPYILKATIHHNRQ